MRKHPLQVEEVKPEAERGFYLSPDAHDQPEEKGVDGRTILTSCAGFKNGQSARRASHSHNRRALNDHHLQAGNLTAPRFAPIRNINSKRRALLNQRLAPRFVTSQPRINKSRQSMF